MMMAFAHAELREFSLASYDSWAPGIVEAIRPAMATWDDVYADPKATPTRHIINPDWHDTSSYGLYADGELKAFARFGDGDEPLEKKLDLLAAPLEAQRRGWGSVLLTLCETIIAEAGCDRLTLFTPAGSREFYEKHGYTPHQALNEEDGKDASRRDIELHMTKQLPPFGGKSA